MTTQTRLCQSERLGPVGRFVSLCDEHTWLAPASALLLTAGLHLFSLLRTPVPFVDEGWYAARAWGLIQTGRAFGTVDAGVIDKYEGYWTYAPWIGTWIQAQAIHLLGPNLLSVRLVSLLFGLALLLAVYAIGRQIGGTRVGIVALLLVSLSKAFFLSAHMARQDIMVAALGFAAIAFYFHARNSSLSLASLASGLAVGLAFEIHPNGILYGLAIITLYIVDYGVAAVRVKGFWVFAIGLAIGLIFYLVLHVLPYPHTYFALTSVIYGPTRVPPLLALDPEVMLRSMREMAVWFLTYVDLLIATIVILLQPLREKNRRLIALLSVFLLAFVALVSTKHDYYSILMSPVAGLILAVYCASVFSGNWHRSLTSYVQTAVVSGLIVASIISNLTPLLDDPTSDYEAVLKGINNSVGINDSVMGPQTYWFGVPDRPYYSWEQLVIYQRSIPGTSLDDALIALHPDVFIVDSRMELFIGYDRTDVYNYPSLQLYLPKRELEGFLSRDSHLAAEISTRTFGKVRVYKVDWSQLSEPSHSASGSYLNDYGITQNTQDPLAGANHESRSQVSENEPWEPHPWSHQAGSSRR